jgi:uncharacterized secreted protein with C-terminal beta-propeller domain
MNSMLKITGISCLVLLLAFSFGCIEPNTPDQQNTSASSALLKKFGSMEELKAFLNSKKLSGGYGYYDTASSGPGIMQGMRTLSAPSALSSGSKAAESGASSDYSQTNIQVAGVDEADIVKSDGRYLYVISGKKLVILDAYPAEDAEILSKTDVGNAIELYVNDDALVVFVNDGYYNTSILQYDLKDRSDPALERNMSVEGRYFDSRMIDEFVYVIANKPVYYYGGDDTPEPPIIRYGSSNTSPTPDVYYFDEPAYSYRFTTVLSIDLESDKEEPEHKIFLMGASQDLYVSQENIYVTYRKIPDYAVLRSNPAVDAASLIIPMPPIEYKDETAIHRISIKDGSISYGASGSVPGWILNQFSMDEHKGYFRVATTTGHVSRFEGAPSSTNNIYTLDTELKTVGKLEDLAPGEQIYSARFMGDRAYLVTFRKVDPLFVIDLKDPKGPKVLGKLKIPGYSDYLHPYDENHIIGLGKEAIGAEEGDFAWYQGVKIALFDVTDVSKPKELAKYEIGDRGTDSYALRDHKAFLFSRSKNLLVVPILLAEIDEEKYPSGVPSWYRGEYTYQGAYVFNISAENGIKLKGTITHVDDNSTFLKSGYYYSSPYSVKRSLYMDDVLYTISDKSVKMNRLDDLTEVNEIELPYEEQKGYYYYE